jgi:hypothetical protein
MSDAALGHPPALVERTALTTAVTAVQRKQSNTTRTGVAAEPHA